MGATAIFEHCARVPTPTHEAFSFSHEPFRHLRACMRGVARALGDDMELDDLRYGLRSSVSAWLTTPVRFADLEDDSIRALGSPTEVRVRYGVEVERLCEDALDAVADVQRFDNPLRSSVGEWLGLHESTAGALVVFCHRKSREEFERVALEAGRALGPGQFVHSWSDYAALEPTNTLLKVGPLRSRGWGCAPHCIVSAPRYETLLQFVWEGCEDEPHFGQRLDRSVGRSARKVTTFQSPDRLAPRTASTAERRGSLGTPHDDLAYNEETTAVLRSAILLHLDGGLATLVARRSQLAVAYRDEETIHVEQVVPAEGLPPGAVLVRPRVADMDLGGNLARDGHLAETWRLALQEQLRKDPRVFIQRLRLAGLRHKHLESAVRRWAEPASTVIHAPKRFGDFQTLLGELGLRSGSAPGNARLFWPEAAWREVRHSRGEAVQAGIEEHSIVTDELLKLVGSLLAELDDASRWRESLSLTLPPTSSFSGEIILHPILGVEEGFRVPADMLGVILASDEVDEWRS